MDEKLTQEEVEFRFKKIICGDHVPNVFVGELENQLFEGQELVCIKFSDRYAAGSPHSHKIEDSFGGLNLDELRDQYSFVNDFISSVDDAVGKIIEMLKRFEGLGEDELEDKLYPVKTELSIWIKSNLDNREVNLASACESLVLGLESKIKKEPDESQTSGTSRI